MSTAKVPHALSWGSFSLPSCRSPGHAPPRQTDRHRVPLGYWEHVYPCASLISAQGTTPFCWDCGQHKGDPYKTTSSTGIFLKTPRTVRCHRPRLDSSMAALPTVLPVTAGWGLASSTHKQAHRTGCFLPSFHGRHHMSPCLALGCAFWEGRNQPGQSFSTLVPH